MAALPYIQLYVADYLADTMHLTTEEHGAYLLLIFNYWQTGKPLINDDRRLANVARLSNERWQQVKPTLEELFNVTETKWHHKRIDSDLDTANQKQKKAVEAGKASAEAKKRAKLKSDKSKACNDRSTGVEQASQHGANHTEQNRTDKNRTEQIRTDNSEDTEAKASLSPEPDKSGPPPCPHERIIDLYHEALPELPRVLKARWKGSASERNARSRWREDGKHRDLEFWRCFFDAVRTNPHWLGDNGRGWQADLHWLLKRENFDKVCQRGAANSNRSRASPMSRQDQISAANAAAIRDAMAMPDWGES